MSNEDNRDLKDILEEKLAEDNRGLKEHEALTKFHLTQSDFHRLRVAYLQQYVPTINSDDPSTYRATENEST